MKKKMFFTVAAALLLGAAVCFSGCGAKAGKLYDAKEKDPVVAVRELIDIPAGYELQFVNRWGTATLQAADGSDTWAYYNVETGKSVIIEGTTYPVSGDMRYKSSGPNDAGLYEYNVYCGGELYSSGTSMQAPAVSNGVLYTDREIYYSTPEGIPVKGVGTVDAVLTASYFHSGDTYYSMTGDMIYSFKESGKFCGATSIWKIIPDWDGSMRAYWAVGGKLFVQYSAAVPDDSQKYTYYNGTEKMKLVTRSYDLGSCKVESHDDFGFVVDNVWKTEDDYVLVSGSRVTEDKLLTRQDDILQTFGTDGKVYVDLQSLMPGVEGVAFEDGYAFLAAGDRVQIYKGSSLRGTIWSFSGMTYTGSGTVSYGNRQYTPDGEFLRAFGEGEKVVWTNGKGTTYYTKDAGAGEIRLCSEDKGGVVQERGSDPREVDDGLWLVKNASGTYSLIDIRSDTVVFENVALAPPAVTLFSMENEEKEKTYTVIQGENRYWLLTETKV